LDFFSLLSLCFLFNEPPADDEGNGWLLLVFFCFDKIGIASAMSTSEPESSSELSDELRVVGSGEGEMEGGF